MIIFPQDNRWDVKAGSREEKRAQEIIAAVTEKEEILKSLDNVTISGPTSQGGVSAKAFPLDANLTIGKIYIQFPVTINGVGISGTMKYNPGKGTTKDAVSCQHICL